MAKDKNYNPWVSRVEYNAVVRELKDIERVLREVEAVNRELIPGTDLGDTLARKVVEYVERLAKNHDELSRRLTTETTKAVQAEAALKRFKPLMEAKYLNPGCLVYGCQYLQKTICECGTTMVCPDIGCDKNKVQPRCECKRRAGTNPLCPVHRDEGEPNG